MIDHFQPGQERLIELVEGRYLRGLKFRQKIGADKAKETFYFALALGVVSGGQNALHTQVAQAVSNCFDL